MASAVQVLDARVDQSEEILMDVSLQKCMKLLRISPAEVVMSEAIKRKIMELGDRAGAGETIPYEQLYEEVNQIAEQYGCEYGIPIPATGEMQRNFPVMAPGIPLAHIIEGNRLMEEHLRSTQRTESAQELVARGICVRNSWEELGDRTVCVVDTADGPMYWPEYHAGRRLRKLMDTMGTRMSSHLTAEAEIKALDLLKTKINDSQWRCYVLNDCFLEKSKRSDLYYIFRKGLPTLVISYHGYPGGRVLAALCLHPMGYFAFTHAGLMTPTDEVIAHLLLMRGDEHTLWKKSGQWRASDSRSGI